MVIYVCLPLCLFSSDVVASCEAKQVLTVRSLCSATLYEVVSCARVCVCVCVCVFVFADMLDYTEHRA